MPRVDLKLCFADSLLRYLNFTLLTEVCPYDDEAVVSNFLVALTCGGHLNIAGLLLQVAPLLVESIPLFLKHSLTNLTIPSLSVVVAFINQVSQDHR